MERDIQHNLNDKEIQISTHTLTWSVTGEEIDIDVVEIISTHTLTWSVTCKSRYRSVQVFPISTHTLTWSVTCWRPLQRERMGNFNSHAHVERDPFHKLIF